MAFFGKTAEPRGALTASEVSRPLRVLLAIHASRDGHTAVYNHATELSEYIQQQGGQSTILTPDDFPWVTRVGARFVPLLYPIALALWLFRRAGDFDVASFHSYAGWLVSVLAPLVPTFRRLRKVIQFHGLEPLYYARLKEQSESEGRLLSLRYRLISGHLMLSLLRLACRRADLVLCHNRQERHFLVGNHWVSSHRVHQVANPVAAEFIVEREHRERAQRLLFVGQWLSMKGIRYLVEAFTLLRRDHPAVELCCAGTLAEEEAVLQAFPSDLWPYVSVRPRVTRAELVQLHRESDIFVFPTLSEGFSLALVEAMASALPIVTTETGASPDILVDCHSVVFCPPKQSGELALAIRELLDDKVHREFLGRNAQLAAKELRPETVWREYFDCFTNVMKTAGEESLPLATERLVDAD